MKIKLVLAISAIVLSALASPVLAGQPGSTGSGNHSGEHASDGNAGGNDNGVSCG